MLLAILFTISQHSIAQDHADRNILTELLVKEKLEKVNEKELFHIDVASMDITIPGLISINATEDLTVYRYAFDKGDQIRIDLHMKNRKGTNNLMILSYPDMQVIYKKNSFSELNNVSIPVKKKAIYVFNITSNHTFDRQATLKIGRVFDDEGNKYFNTGVSYREKYKPVKVHSPQKFYLNSTSNQKFKGGKNRVLLPVVLPSNTVSWYYEYAVSRESDYINRVQKSMNLMGQLSKLIDQSGFLQFTINQIGRPPGTNIADIYLLDSEGINYFIAGYDPNYYTEGSRENFQDGVVEISSMLQEGLHLGLQNQDKWHGVNIAIEVVAIVKSGEWLMDEI